MAFTLVTITGEFANPDGSPATGLFTATLSASLWNAGEQLAPVTITGIVANGLIEGTNQEAFMIEATDDIGTTPPDVYYSFRLSLDGASTVSEFNAPLSISNGITQTYEALENSQV
jgi:hypothetical protein